MKNHGINYTRRTRINPELSHQLRLRMEELGFHPDQHLHLGDLTWLFTHREWVLVTKKGNTGVTIYPAEKTLKDVTGELGDW